MKKTKILVFVLLVALCLSCFAACNKTPKELVDARDYLYNQYKEFDGKATPADFNRVGAVMINGTKYPIEWTVEVKTEGQSESVKVVKNEDGTVTVDVDEKAAVEISYDLTATISNAKGKTITVTFHHTVPQFKELTYAEYYATEAGKTVVVKGVITAIISKERGNTVNGFYMQDQDGGYYVYGMVSGQTPESLGLKVGMTVRAAGEKDIYNGTHEIKDAGVEILDETITAVTPADYTEIFTKAAKLSDEALTAKQSTVVTLKGVTVKENGGSDGSYYYFELAGKKSYVRISSSACPLTKDEITAFKAGFESSFGKVGNVTGIISLYDGSFYLTPISGTPFTDLQLPVLSDADAVAFEKGALTFMSLIGYDGSYDLAFQGSAYTDVVISWALDKEYAGVSIADNKLVVELQEEAQTIKLVATIKRGEATDTKEFEVAIDAATTQNYLPVAITEAKEGTYKFALYQANLGKWLYFNGEITSDEYLATTEKFDKAADVVVAKVADKNEYTLKVGDKYIEVYKRADGKARLQLVADATTNWVWNADLKLFTTTVDGKVYYLGTYKTYNTFSASETSYISGDNATKVGVSQFVAQLSTLELREVAFQNIVEAKEGTYKFALYQANLGKWLYFNGEITSDEYLATTEKFDKAADVVVAKVADKNEYTLKVGDKYIEVYKRADGKARLQLVADATTNWVWNADLKLFTTTVDGKVYYLGTYKTYNTFSASETSYISGDNATKIGVSQFVAQLGLKDFVKEESAEKTDAEKLEEIKVAGTVKEDFDLDENATWTVKSGEGIAISGTKATVTRGEEDSTVVITATIGEATKDFTIVVKAKTKIYVDADNKITLIIQDYAEVSGWTNGTQYKTIDAGKATISVDKGTNTGKFYTSGYEWRTYQNENPTITVEAKEGYTIVSVKITYTIKNTGVLLNGETQVASGTVITVNGTKIELTVGNTGTATNGQVKITAIEIVYAAA